MFRLFGAVRALCVSGGNRYDPSRRLVAGVRFSCWGAMKPSAFEYESPPSLAEAVRLLDDSSGMRKDLAQVRAKLGGGNAIQRAADEVMGVREANVVQVH